MEEGQECLLQPEKALEDQKTKQAPPYCLHRGVFRLISLTEGIRQTDDPSTMQPLSTASPPSPDPPLLQREGHSDDVTGQLSTVGPPVHHFREDQNKPSHIPFRAYVHLHRAGTCKPEASHCTGMNTMKGQRWRPCCQHSYSHHPRSTWSIWGLLCGIFHQRLRVGIPT